MEKQIYYHASGSKKHTNIYDKDGCIIGIFTGYTCRPNGTKDSYGGCNIFTKDKEKIWISGKSIKTEIGIQLTQDYIII